MEGNNHLIKLDQFIAQKIVNQLSKVISYNINIMDEKGLIIASTDPKRIETFHEIAIQLLTQNQKQIDVYDSEQLIGTKRGVNLALEYRDAIIGVIGVTGDPDEVRPIAALLKVSVENLYELELQQSATLNRTTQKDQLFHHLLYFNNAASDDMVHLATELGYNADSFRIPILFNVPRAQDQETVSIICKKSRYHTKQDMLVRSIEGNPLVFLHMEQNNEAEIDYAAAVERYLTPIQRELAEESIEYSIIVGSIQNRLKMYHIAYQHCIWLLQYLKTPGSAKIYWFYHYVQPYLQSCLPLSELSGVYKAYSKMLPGKFWANYTPIIRQMNSNMNNMVKASAQLHMHKNTLVYRYNRIRDALHIDPMNHLSDAEFANNLCYYLEREKE